MYWNRIYLLLHCFQVLCVLLLQNAGPKSKDVSARSLAIDILGTIAARLKRDAVSSQDKFWVLRYLLSEDDDNDSYAEDMCYVCMGGRGGNLLICSVCRKLFHPDCLGVKEHEMSNRSWSCQICTCRKQLLVLQSFCKSQYKDSVNKKKLSKDDSASSGQVAKVEIVQQLLLNYLQDMAFTDDLHLFICWCVLMS